MIGVTSVWMMGALLACGAKQTAPAPLWSTTIAVRVELDTQDQITLYTHNLTRQTIVVETVEYLVFSSKYDSERSDRLTPGVNIEHDSVESLSLGSVANPNRVSGTITWRGARLLAEAQHHSFDLPLSTEPQIP